jgi:predicted phosphodiesterase
MHDHSWLFFGGPYGNLQATQALLAEARSLGVPPERILCTGDLVAYCGDPVATIDLIRDAGIAVVMGNCDEQIGAAAADCGCGFDPGSACARLSADWYAFANSVVRADQRTWLAGLPRRIDLRIGMWSFAAIHGAAHSINEFIFAGTPESAKAKSLDLLGCDGVIGGHCGLPFTDQVGERLWHNPGVIGMPANDGTPRVWFSLVTPSESGLCIERRALAYDHEAARAAMRRAELPQCYQEALITGLWPSLDVLPQRERREAGTAIDESRIFWPDSSTSRPMFAA